jgi:hypothetical protein
MKKNQKLFANLSYLTIKKTSILLNTIIYLFILFVARIRYATALFKYIIALIEFL